MKVRFVIALFILVVSSALAKEFYSLDGTGNNLQNPQWGANNDTYIRYVDKADYPDGAGNIMSGQDRPGARVITNFFAANRAQRQSPLRLTDFFTFFGEFMTVDVALKYDDAKSPQFIQVPKCDPFKDPVCLGNQTIRFLRLVAGPSNGPDDPRPSINRVSSFIDAQNVYGTSPAAINRTRTRVNGTITEVWNATAIVKAADPQVGGLGYIFVKEHNRLAQELAAANPDWDDERLFQEARRWVIAFIQKIFTREYTAALLGQPLPAYKGYNPEIRPSCDNFMANCAFRYGHAEINSFVARLDENYNEDPKGYMQLKDCFNSSPGTKCYNAGWAPLFRGMCAYAQKLVEPYWVDDVRNWAQKGSATWGNTIASGADLAAIDIQRGRDQGFADYNTMRAYFGLPRHENFSTISSDQTLNNLLATLYNNSIDDIDAYIGGLAEDHVSNANVGPLFWQAMYNGLIRLRDGDRLWYENGQFSDEDLATVYGTTLSAIVARNFNVSDLPLNLFFVRERQLNATVVPFLYNADDKYTNYLDLSTTYRLSWFVDGDEIQFKIQAAVTGWVGVGFEPDTNTMKNADIYIGHVITDANGNQITEVFDRYAQDVGVPTPDADLGGVDNILWFSGNESNGITTIEFRRKLDTGDKWDKVIRPDKMKTIFAFNPNTDDFLYHGPTRASNAFINFLEVTPKPVLTEYSSGLRIFIAVMAGAGCLLVAVLIALVFLYKDKFIFYTPLFCVLIAMGGLIGYIYMFTLMADQSSKSVCIAQIWMIGYAFILMFGSLFTKTWRIWRITVEAEQRKRIKITDWFLLQLVGFMILAETIYLAIWTGAGAPRPETVSDPLANDDLKYVCHSPSAMWSALLIAVKSVLLFGGVYLTWRVRSVPKEFNESKTIGVAVYTVAIVAVIAIPIIVTLGNIPTAVFLIKALAVWLSVTASLLILFVPKLWAPTVLVGGQTPSEAMKSAKERTKTSGSKSGSESGTILHNEMSRTYDEQEMKVKRTASETN